MLLEAGMERRARSVRLSEYLIARWEERLAPLGFRLNSPRDPAERGSHVSLGHADGLRINLALIHDQKVLPDFRRRITSVWASPRSTTRSPTSTPPSNGCAPSSSNASTSATTPPA